MKGTQQSTRVPLRTYLRQATHQAQQRRGPFCLFVRLLLFLLQQLSAWHGCEAKQAAKHPPEGSLPAQAEECPSYIGARKTEDKYSQL